MIQTLKSIGINHRGSSDGIIRCRDKTHKKYGHPRKECDEGECLVVEILDSLAEGGPNDTLVLPDDDEPDFAVSESCGPTIEILTQLVVLSVIAISLKPCHSGYILRIYQV